MVHNVWLDLALIGVEARCTVLYWQLMSPPPSASSPAPSPPPPSTPARISVLFLAIKREQAAGQVMGYPQGALRQLLNWCMVNLAVGTLQIKLSLHLPGQLLILGPLVSA